MKQFAVVGPLIICLSLGSAEADHARNSSTLQQQLSSIVAKFPGRVGVSVQDGSTLSTLKPSAPFPLQSVMKLIVAAAVLDSVDRGKFHLSDKIVVRTSNLSVFVEPIAALVTKRGYTTNLRDLIRRAMIDSDNAAADILFVKAGGTVGLSRFLGSRGIRGVRVDREERQLQTEIRGLRWQRDFIDPKVFDKAVAAVPKVQRDAAWKHYMVDVRDTATPYGMGSFLQSLSGGRMLSKDSTKFILGAMQEAKTAPDRLKAGLPAGWSIAHKSGSSGSWDGVTAATNDVGILTAPDGAKIPVAVFVADSTASDVDRAALIARIAKAIVASHGQH